MIAVTAVIAVVVLRGTVIAHIIGRTDFLRALSVALGPRHL